MKRIAIILTCIIPPAAVTAHTGPGDDVSKTFYTVRPLFQSTSPEKDAFFRDSFIFRDDDQRNKVEIVAFGSQTTNGQGLAKYFLPFGHSSILVASDGAEHAADRDVNAIHLNIAHENGQFESRVHLCPQQTVWGLGFRYRQWLSRVVHTNDFFKGFWFELSFPFMRVENTMGFCEEIINAGDTVQATRVANAAQAFNQCAWMFGKIAMCPLRATGVGDVELKIGWEAVHEDIAHFESYVGAVIPTGDRPCGRHVFEPIVGSNRHWGITWGSLLAVTCWEREAWNISTLIELNRRYLFDGDEVRSFDLVGKPWSRYMEVYPSQAVAVTAQEHAGNPELGDHGYPGINYFTRCVRVRPGYVTTVNNAYLLIHKGFHGEAGYTFFARQKEEIRFKKGGGSCLGIEYDPALVSATEGGYTTQARTINKNFNGACTDHAPDDYVRVSCGDFDLNSAQHPAVLSHTLYLSLGYSWDELEYPCSLGIGGAYEMGSNNANSDRWTGWARCAVAW